MLVSKALMKAASVESPNLEPLWSSKLSVINPRFEASALARAVAPSFPQRLASRSREVRVLLLAMTSAMCSPYKRGVVIEAR
eukprot:scaffold95827_cov25-Tisochrysis_lutea.AAC.2